MLAAIVKAIDYGTVVASENLRTGNTLSEIVLAELEVGDVVRTIAGSGESRQEYRFTITEAGTTPAALLQERFGGAGEPAGWVGPVAVRVIGSIDGIDLSAELTDINQDLDVMEESDELPEAEHGVLRTNEHILVTDERHDVVPPRGHGWHVLTPEIRAITRIHSSL